MTRDGRNDLPTRTAPNKEPADRDQRVLYWLDGGNRPFALLHQLNLTRAPGLVNPGLELVRRPSHVFPARALD